MVSDFSDWSRSHQPVQGNWADLFYFPWPMSSCHDHFVPGYRVSVVELDPELDIFPKALSTPKGRHTYCHLLSTRGIMPWVFLWTRFLASWAQATLYNPDTVAAAATISNICGVLITPQVGRDYTP